MPDHTLQFYARKRVKANSVRWRVAWELATGEILYLTDADCVFEDEALLRLVAPLADGETMVATGSSRPLDEQMDRVLPIYLWAAGLAVDTRRPLQSSGLLGRNAVVAREAIDRIGGLDFEAPTGTDYQLARRLLEAGFSIRFVRESVVASAFPETSWRISPQAVPLAA